MMKNPMWINLQTSDDVRAQGWAAESRDTDGHLCSAHAPFQSDAERLRYINEEVARGKVVTIFRERQPAKGAINMHWQPIKKFEDDGDEPERDLWVITKPITLDSGKDIAAFGMRLCNCLFSDGQWIHQPFPLDDAEPVLGHFDRITHYMKVGEP